MTPQKRFLAALTKMAAVFRIADLSEKLRWPK